MAEFHQTYVYGRGWIEVIVGGMFSGKTEELIRRLRRAEYARQNIQVFKPIIDDRYHAEDVTSHNYNSIKATAIHNSKDILPLLKSDTQVVGIDEGQFFDHEIVQIAGELASRGVRVLIAGLDTDWQAKPFGPMPTLMAIAESVTKQHAVCVVCGAPASRTQRTFNSSFEPRTDATVVVSSQLTEQVLVGSNDMYEARCRDHFKPEVVRPTKIEKQKKSDEQPSINKSTADQVEKIITVEEQLGL